jgi:hypothetical protein
MTVSEAVLRARWVEAETIHLKRMGLSFEAIAEQITRVGRSQAQAMVTVPDGVKFLQDYKITRQACHQAFRKAISREPALEVEELRRLDNARSEEMYLNLQPVIRKGNTRAVEVGLKVLEHVAKINGYAAPETVNTQNNISVAGVILTDPWQNLRLILEAAEELRKLGVDLPVRNYEALPGPRRVAADVEPGSE